MWKCKKFKLPTLHYLYCGPVRTLRAVAVKLEEYTHFLAYSNKPRDDQDTFDMWYRTNLTFLDRVSMPIITGTQMKTLNIALRT